MTRPAGRRPGEIAAAVHRNRGEPAWLRKRATAVLAAFALGAASSASAQYSYDPSNADEQVPGMRYFGSARDEKGTPLPGVSLVFDTGPSVYVFVTDDIGRFRGQLPLDTVPGKVTATCRKAGFRSVRVTQRVGKVGPRRTVQVDCVLQAGA